MVTVEMIHAKVFLIEIIVLVYSIIKCIMISCINLVLPVKRKDISNDVILITGGNKGIGRHIALEFVKHNPKHIILWGKEESSLKDVSLEINTLGVCCTYNVCDVANREQVYLFAAEISSKIGPVSILVNNAGVVSGKDFIHSKDEDIRSTMEVNTMAHFWTTKAFLQSMLENNHGHIVCISSLIGLISIPGVADYAASKFAVTGFMETLYYELSAMNKYGVHTTTVHPYLVDTEMFSGCTFRFASLIPPLKQTYVAKRTVDAVLKNSKMIIMPRLMYFVLVLKSILPVECIVLVQRFTGVDKTMTYFHGRRSVPNA